MPTHVMKMLKHYGDVKTLLGYLQCTDTDTRMFTNVVCAYTLRPMCMHTPATSIFVTVNVQARVALLLPVMLL